MAHTFDVSMADRLEDASRYRYCSREELVALVDPDPGDRILDLGSGTGFYTRDLAPFAGTVVGIDVQRGMHDLFGEHGVPANVSRVTANAEALPIAASAFDAALTTMTFHEIATDAGLAELARSVRAGGRFAVVDWTANGDGESGPPLEDRKTVDEAASMLEAAEFEIESAQERPETFVLVAVAGE
ncbi:MAG: class I SAM-dependent methyltransferase [Halobacteriales archaeon]